MTSTNARYSDTAASRHTLRGACQVEVQCPSANPLDNICFVSVDGLNIPFILGLPDLMRHKRRSL